jgi:hypothetical protein
VSDKATQWPHEWTVIKPMLPNKARGELAASDRLYPACVDQVVAAR